MIKNYLRLLGDGILLLKYNVKKEWHLQKAKPGDTKEELFRGTSTTISSNNKFPQSWRYQTIFGVNSPVMGR
jgi:hypothetical protein